MTITRLMTFSTWEPKIGYARAVIAGGWLHISGTTGTDHATGTIPDQVTDQCALALKIIAAALERAGAGFENVVRVTYVLPDRADFEPCWPLLRDAFGANPPAATMLQAGLIDPRHKIEIEVTAWLGDTSAP